MPTRKQRKRRAKDFRHDMRVFEVDAEGNEMPLAELRRRRSASRRCKQQQSKGKSRSARPIKEPPLPSWNRAIKRGGTMGGLMLVAFLFVLKSGPLPQRIGIGLFYGLAFIPLTYWIDRTAHRTYQRRLAKQSETKT